MGCCLSEFSDDLPMFLKDPKSRRSRSNSESDDQRNWNR